MELIAILIKDSALCDFAKKKILNAVKTIPDLNITFLDYDEDYDKFAKMNIKLEGLPTFLLLNENHEIIKKYVGGDQKTIESIINELKDN